MARKASPPVVPAAPAKRPLTAAQIAFSNAQKNNGPCIGKIKDDNRHTTGHQFKNKAGDVTTVSKMDLI